MKRKNSPPPYDGTDESWEKLNCWACHNLPLWKDTDARLIGHGPIKRARAQAANMLNYALFLRDKAKVQLDSFVP
jgi:hypothetical protein